MFSIKEFADSSRLPTLPEVALKLVDIARQDDPDFGEISRIIRSDPVVAGKILKTANSAIFGFRQKIETIEQAVPKLGITLLRTLILSFHLANHKSDQDRLEPLFQQIWRGSLTQAVFAELIAEKVKSLDPPTCFLAGMMQDIGILAMASEAPSQYLDIVLSRAKLPNVVTAERCEFGFSHVDVSVEIVKNWGLDERFGAAISRHHDHVVEANAKSDLFGCSLQAANLGAAVLVSTPAAATPLDSSLDQWIGFLNTHLGLSAVQAEEMISEVNQRVGEYSTIFKFNIGENVQSEKVVAEAKSLLQEIAINNQLELASSYRKSRKQKDAENAIYRDSLSGLFNRRFMDDNLNDQLAKHIKKRKPLALMFLDVDKFKSINDSYGHSVGDKAICHVADWLTKSLRKDDLAIRLGGDEFLVILRSVKETEFEPIARRIVESTPKLELSDGTQLDISLSIGCTIYQPVRGDSVDANWLIDRADQSMYEAKKMGGDSVSVQKFVGEQQTCDAQK